jgi:hypothetical protein
MDAKKPVKNWEPDRYKSPEQRAAAYRKARAAGEIPLTEKYKANVKRV